MKIAGITAEYNPFHAGHEYLFGCIDDYYGSEPHVKLVVMSGNYVQRGEPAIFDKYVRTEEALRRGADIVLELPVSAALSSAEGFASGAVSILSGCGAERIFFGSESGDRESILELSEILANEPEEVGESIRRMVSEGVSFPKARALSVSEYLKRSGRDEAAELLSSPNDILGIEYSKAIKRMGADIAIEPVRRVGQGYNDTAKTDTPFPSASAVREELKRDLSELRTGAGNKTDAGITPVTAEDFSGLLRFRLLQEAENKTDALINEELMNSLLGTLSTPLSFSETIERVKSKRFTYSAISRALMHVILELPEKNTEGYTKAPEGIPYARILGFRKSASGALKTIHGRGQVRLITKPAEGRDIPGFLADVRSARIYNQVVYDLYGRVIPDEYLRGPVIL